MRTARLKSPWSVCDASKLVNPIEKPADSGLDGHYLARRLRLKEHTVASIR
jgi:hypothetical protein